MILDFGLLLDENKDVSNNYFQHLLVVCFLKCIFVGAELSEDSQLSLLAC